MQHHYYLPYQQIFNKSGWDDAIMVINNNKIINVSTGLKDFF